MYLAQFLALRTQRLKKTQTNKILILEAITYLLEDAHMQNRFLSKVG